MLNEQIKPFFNYIVSNCLIFLANFLDDQKICKDVHGFLISICYYFSNILEKTKINQSKNFAKEALTKISEDFQLVNYQNENVKFCINKAK